jgi:hypothetical protein
MVRLDGYANIAIKIVKATGGEVSLEDLGLDQRAIDKIRLKQQKVREKKNGKGLEGLKKLRKTLQNLFSKPHPMAFVLNILKLRNAFLRRADELME